MGFIFGIVAPVFGVVAVGFAAAKAGAFAPGFVRGLSRFTFSFAVPALLFEKMATSTFPETLDGRLLLVYYGALLSVWALGMGLGARLFKRQRTANAIMGMGATYGNLVMIGLPLSFRAFGDPATLPALMILAVHSAIQFTLVVVLLESGRGPGGAGLVWRTVKGGLGNPIVIALLGGAAVNFTGLPLPGIVIDILRQIGQAALPAATFTLGASLAGYRIAGNLAVALCMTALKLLVFPALVFGLGLAVGVAPTALKVAVLLAAMPVGINVFLFANNYRAGEASAASAIVLSSLLSLASLSGLLYLLDSGLVGLP